jgi:hypothetical protein
MRSRRNAQPAPLRVTLVHHDQAVRKFVAELTAEQRWAFDTQEGFADAVATPGVPISDTSDAASGTPPPVAALCNYVTHLTHLTCRGGSAPPAAAEAHMLLALSARQRAPATSSWSAGWQRCTARPGSFCSVSRPRRRWASRRSTRALRPSFCCRSSAARGEREKECQEEEVTESWGRDDDLPASQGYPLAYPNFATARPSAVLVESAQLLWDAP